MPCQSLILKYLHRLVIRQRQLDAPFPLNKTISTWHKFACNVIIVRHNASCILATLTIMAQFSRTWTSCYLPMIYPVDRPYQVHGVTQPVFVPTVHYLLSWASLRHEWGAQPRQQLWQWWGLWLGPHLQPGGWVNWQFGSQFCQNHQNLRQSTFALGVEFWFTDIPRPRL